MDDSGKYLILLVDDDGNFREVIKTKLEAAGFAVAEAVNGEEGFEKTKQLKPNLVFMDVQMPKMNGIECLSKIKADPEITATKVIFLTNYGEENSADKTLDDKFAKDIGALGHMRKTDDLDKMIQRVKQELR